MPLSWGVVHALNGLGPVFLNHAALDLERRGQFSVFNGEISRQDLEFFDLLDPREQWIDLIGDPIADVRNNGRVIVEIFGGDVVEASKLLSDLGF